MEFRRKWVISGHWERERNFRRVTDSFRFFQFFFDSTLEACQASVAKEPAVYKYGRGAADTHPCPFRQIPPNQSPNLWGFLIPFKLHQVQIKLPGEILNVYGLLGAYDVLAVAEFPDNRAAMKASARVGNLIGAKTNTMAAVERDDFLKLLTEL